MYARDGEPMSDEAAAYYLKLDEQQEANEAIETEVLERAADAVADGGPVPLVALEGIGEFATSVIEMGLSTLVKRAGRGEAFLVVAGELAEWTSSFGLLGEIKSARRGVILQPETHDGELVLKTPFPRLMRGELPVGRGILAHRGKLVRVQFPLMAEPQAGQGKG